MATFDNPETLSASLTAAAIECSVSDGFVELPSEDGELTATLQLTGGWLVFKVYLGEWPHQFDDCGFPTLLRLHDRLLGLRFSVVDNELWVIQDFPVEILNDRFDTYVRNAFWVLRTILPALMHHLSSAQPMSEDDIDAMFDRLDAGQIN